MNLLEIKELANELPESPQRTRILELLNKEQEPVAWSSPATDNPK